MRRAVTAMAVLLAACGGGHKSSVTVSSPAFTAGGRIPTRYSCEGDNVPPPLRWGGGPSGTAAYAIVVEDPDAPHPPFYHWVVSDIPPSTTSFDRFPLPAGATTAIASSGSAEYVGMCPPDKATHHYRFTVYALKHETRPLSTVSGADAVSEIKRVATAHGTLAGVFGR